MTVPIAAEPADMTQTDDVDCRVNPGESGVIRVEIRPRPGEPDPRGQALLAQAKRQLGNVTGVHTARVYLIQAPLSDEQAQTVAQELLSHPLNQVSTPGARPVDDRHSMLEVHYQPGVMDPVSSPAR